MYKVTALTREDYLKEADYTGRNLKSIDTFVQNAAPSLQPWFYNAGPNEPGMTFKMIAYGKFTYTPLKNSRDTVDWPVIGMALQKNYISIYVSITKGGKPLVDYYANVLGYTRRGNNNFSFESFEQLNQDAFKQMLIEAAQIFKKDPLNPVRFKEKTA